MALLTAQEVDLDGLAPVYSAISASDTFVPDDRTFLHIKNAGGSADTVTVATPGTAAGGLAVADSITSVPATTGDRMIGPFPAQHFADPLTGLATVTHSFTTTVTGALLRVPQRV